MILVVPRARARSKTWIKYQTIYAIFQICITFQTQKGVLGVSSIYLAEKTIFQRHKNLYAWARMDTGFVQVAVYELTHMLP